MVRMVAVKLVSKSFVEMRPLLAATSHLCLSAVHGDVDASAAKAAPASLMGWLGKSLHFLQQPARGTWG